MKRFGIFLLLCLALPPWIQAQVQAQRSYDLYDSVGVDTHWFYGNPTSDDYVYLYQRPALMALMQQAHLDHFRDGQFAQGYPPQWIVDIYKDLASNGLKAELIVNDGQTLAQLEPALKAYAGLEAIEAPNEWDLNGGATWPTTMLSDLVVLRQAGNDLGVPVLGPSLTQGSSFARLGDVSQYIDYVNMHPYTGGRNPETAGWGGGYDSAGHQYGSLEWNLDMVHEYGPGLPAYATETGFQSSATPAQSEVPESVAGTYAPRLILEYFKQGVKRTYFYELVDDPTWAQPGFGLLRHDLSPKPAYTAVKNLLSIFKDDDTDFVPEWLDYALGGNMNGVETVLVEKSNGDFYLNVWLDGSIYDATNLVATPQTPQQLTLTVPAGMAVTYVASFNSDGTITESAPNASTYTVNANSCVTTIRIANVAAADPGQPGQPVTATPVFSVRGGTYSSAQSVAISDATAGAAIYYTTDGSAPTTNARKYAGPITVNGSETILAMAVAPGYSASAAASATYAIDVAAPDYAVAIAPGTLTVAPGQSGSATLTIAALNGFDSAVTFACTGLPAGTACSFAPASVTPLNGAATTTVTISSSASASMRPSPGTAIPLAALAGVFCWMERRRRRWAQWMLAVAGVVGLSFLTACSSTAITSQKAAAGAAAVSTVTVTATAGSIQRTAVLTVTMQ